MSGLDLAGRKEADAARTDVPRSEGNGNGLDGIANSSEAKREAKAKRADIAGVLMSHTNRVRRNTREIGAALVFLLKLCTDYRAAFQIQSSWGHNRPPVTFRSSAPSHNPQDLPERLAD